CSPFYSDTLTSVTTVQLGEPATLECFFSAEGYSSRKVQWYKQSIGETLELITTLFVGPELKVESTSRYELKTFINMSHLTISSTIQEDEAMYHCAVSDWKSANWSGTFLAHTFDIYTFKNILLYQVIMCPVYEGDPVTLQCSLLSDTENKACPAEHSVFWFRAGSDESHPRMIYTHGNRSDGCEKSPEAGSPPQSCVYNFSKSSVSSSDAGTYYCAVATCGEILFGNATKLDIEGKFSIFRSWRKFSFFLSLRKWKRNGNLNV
uniref:Ig-like domain-containing protein n=1 Tax=Myripristis murdjan TaxID=586833 RepID=A0A667WKG3_9TELE